MEKMIAIAVDDSRDALQAVRYAARMAAVIPGARFALVHIQPALSGYLLETVDRSLKARKELNAILSKNRAAADALLERCRQEMVRLGVAADRTVLRTRPRSAGVAEDIMSLSLAESYDAVVVGRRGVSYLQELIMGSVTANLIEHSRLTPIWVVDGQVPGTGVAAAVDGSPASLRALDHLAFMLCGSAENRICMLHVQPRLSDYCQIEIDETQTQAAEQAVLDSDRKCMDDFYPQALRVIENNGFDSSRVDFQILPKSFSSAGKSICKAAAAGGFGTIVVGRHGSSLLPGSVVRYLTQKAGDMAVWVVP